MNHRARWIGIYIASLAVLLAICGVGGGNATKDAGKANLDASNMWAFFQAKNARRTAYELAQHQLELTLLANPGLPPDARAAMGKTIAEYKERIHHYSSDKVTNEGLDELFARAKVFEQARDVALARDPYFDYGGAFLQIAIVLASVAIVMERNAVLVLSGIVGLAGGAMTLNGYFLILDFLR